MVFTWKEIAEAFLSPEPNERSVGARVADLRLFENQDKRALLPLLKEREITDPRAFEV